MNKMEINQTIKNLVGLDLNDTIEEVENNIKAAFEIEGDVIVSDNGKGNMIAYLDIPCSTEFELIEDEDGIVVEVYAH